VLHYLQVALHHFGYWAVALFMITEGCGIPVPAETMLVTAAAFASHGTLALWKVIVAGAVGGVIGGAAGYWIGAVGGVRFIRRYGGRVGITDARLDRARHFFRARGNGAVVLGRFVAFLRILVPMLAGVTHMPFGRFMLFNAIGSVATAVIYGVLGYEFGRDLHSLEHHLRLATLIALVLVAAVAGVVAWRRSVAAEPKSGGEEKAG